MSKDAWISPNIFEHLASVYRLNNIGAHNFINNEYTLENITSSQMIKTRCLELNGEEINSENSGDVEEKIMPWKPMIPLEEYLSVTLRRQKLADEIRLIVVASLIDIMANLGGLAMTAEIFCAKQLVLGSIKDVDNKEFQMLSVSLQKSRNEKNGMPANLFPLIDVCMEISQAGFKK
ncbi:hypothetical protein KQX54_013383 [Cotesia glomerata]|uniref:Uncharacterized protein n=1 Tax=Cotesia glomerata TaxID=32391 RepID=A0AAV7IDE7_COTGL|nr:hypothetical protein KQX54_013383 [Cotesia glomerata]